MTTSFKTGDKPEYFGNYFIVGLSGPELNETDKQILGKLKPAGILLLKRNFLEGKEYKVWLSALSKLISDIKDYAERDKLIISIDHEGGRVVRAPAPITRFPEPMQYASKARLVARAMACELKTLGVNLSWAPLADIHSNPKNPIIGRRAFGTNVSTVVDAGLEFADELMKNEVLGCAKHFPGHGDTIADSHLELPLVNLTETQLRDRELVPFKALCEAGIPFVMTAHILFPNIDAKFPATLSRKLLNDILRAEINYQGIIVSDDLDMLAVSKHFREPETISQAFNAGCDMFILAGQPKPDADLALGFAKFISKGLSNRLLSEERLHQSFNRIKNLFDTKLKDFPVVPLAKEVFEEHEELARSLTI